MANTKQKINTFKVDMKFSKKQIQRIINFEEDEPFETLGLHVFPENNCAVINAYLPRAKSASILISENQKNIKIQMEKIHDGGFFQAVIKDRNARFSYKIESQDEANHIEEKYDPYSVRIGFTDFDLHLLSEGNHFNSYEIFGAKLKNIDGIDGVQFTVWAPNAKAVGLIGNFNHWKSEIHPMSRVKITGIWTLFIPGLKEGELYKYSIKTKQGDVISKVDPYAYRCEMRPNTASVVSLTDGYKWTDDKWVKKRENSDFLSAPISIYEIHLGSWKRNPKDNTFLSYKDFTKDLISYVKDMGYTHIELMPITEHPLDASWGYQVINFYAPTSRFGKPDEFMHFIDECHKNNIGVILDWVPSHFPKDYHGLNMFDGTQLYAYEDWRRGEHKEWGTLVFDYFRKEVQNFLISNALFWLDKYHIDGLRVDAVASMLYLDYSRKDGDWSPNMYGGREHLEAIDFIKKFNEVIHAQYKGVLTIAEESTAWPGVSRPTYLGGLGFSMKWNMGWMHDTLKYFSEDPINRKYHQDMLTFSMMYAFSENFVLPISHDEVVYGKKSLLEKMPGDDWQKFANLRLFLGYMFCHPGKKLNFMGGEIAQRSEWNFDTSLDWHLLNYESHQKLNYYMKDLNKLYKSYKAMYELDFDWTGFEWGNLSDRDNSVISFIRYSKNSEEILFITCNMTPVPRFNYRLGVPKYGFYKEILNSDAEIYGGSGIGTMGGKNTENISSNGKPYSVVVNLPPLAINIYKFEELKMSKNIKKVKKKNGK